MGLSSRASGYGRVVSSEYFDDLSASSALTIPAGARAALVTVIAQGVRYRGDGTDPTSDIGHYVAANGAVEIFGAELATIRFIEAASGGKLFVTYYKD